MDDKQLKAMADQAQKLANSMTQFISVGLESLPDDIREKVSAEISKLKGKDKEELERILSSNDLENIVKAWQQN